MVRIRLRRVGAKKQPSYRVVVADARSPRDGRFIETIGHYNPRTDPPTVVIKEDRALYWLTQGAQPTDAVTRMLTNLGTLEKFQLVKAGASIEDVLMPEVPPEEPVAEAEAAVEVEAVGEEEAVVEAEPVAEAVVEGEAEPEAAVEEAKEVVIGDESIAVLELSTRVHNTLEAAGIATVGELLEKMAQGRTEMLAIADFGPKALEEVEDRLRARSLLEES